MVYTLGALHPIFIALLLLCGADSTQNTAKKGRSEDIDRDEGGGIAVPSRRVDRRLAAPLPGEGEEEEASPGEVYSKRRFVSWVAVGRGGFGIVYRARDTLRQGRQVAIKAVKDFHRRDLTVASHEAISSTGLTRIPHYYGSFNEDGYSYIVREYLTGLSLLDFITRRQRPLRMETVASVFYQLSYAVSVFHQQGYSHNDLDAENVIVTDVGEDSENLLVQIIDFGLAEELINGRYSPHSLEVWPATAVDICSLGHLLKFLLYGPDYMKEEHEEDDRIAAAGLESLLDITWGACSMSWDVNNKQQGGHHPSVIDILNHPFVRSGKQLANEWPLHECRNSEA